MCLSVCPCGPVGMFVSLYVCAKVSVYWFPSVFGVRVGILVSLLVCVYSCVGEYDGLFV